MPAFPPAPAPPRLLLVANPEVHHIGAHFLKSAAILGVPATLCDVREAYAGPGILRSLFWRAAHRPLRLRRFSRHVLTQCRQDRPTHLISTGMAPLCAEELRTLRSLGVITCSYPTDDPWNPRRTSRWFLQSLPEYDAVFSPRRENLDDLRRLGCRHVHYLPFAYAADVHYPEPAATAGEESRSVLFVGGADADRLPYIRALVASGVPVLLYGSLWERYPEFRPMSRGHASLPLQRLLTPSAGAVLCLVRRINRDGHSMRSFEAPALGGCLLVEDTPEHRDLYGPDSENVVYFHSLEHMVERARWLLNHPAERTRLATAVHARITGGANTYTDRLRTMLETSSTTADTSLAPSP
jgi:hypothetical protein